MIITGQRYRTRGQECPVPGRHPAVHEARSGPPGQCLGRGRRDTSRQIPGEEDCIVAQRVPVFGRCCGSVQVSQGPGGAAFSSRTCL